MKISRDSLTIQTHTNETIASNTSKASAWYPCDGYDKIKIRLKSDAQHSNRVAIDWSDDGITSVGGTAMNEFMPSSNTQVRDGETGVGAKYFRVTVFNLDAAQHVMTVSAYLKT